MSAARASFLVEVSRPDIAFERSFGDKPLKGTFDSRLIAQAFGNVIKNASEAMEGIERSDGTPMPSAFAPSGRAIDRIDVIDNGRFAARASPTSSRALYDDA